MTKEERVAEYRKKHFGECAVANCGMKMFIIAYRNNDDIDIVFQDGTIVCNQLYKDFVSGNIDNPNIGLVLKICNRIGEVVFAKNGQKMMIINYQNFYDADVLFEDGNIVKHVDCKRFKNGYVKNPNFFQNRIGETQTAKNGLEMKIIAYHDSSNIDIEFEDGTVVKKKRYDHFVAGKIKHPKYNPQRKDKRIGETSQSISGQKMTIIKYRSATDIDVQFEDGTVIQHTNYVSFLNGNISTILVSHKKSNPYAIRKPNKFKERLNEESISSLGQKMTIIKYVSADDIDVQFEDGTIVKHKAYYHFKNGSIANPNYKNFAHTSLNEYAILYYLQKYGFIKANQGSLKHLGFGKMELDCYHPTLNIAIEYDGYWHKEKNDIRKNEACKKAGIVLIRIRESTACKITNNYSKNFYLTDDKQLSKNFNEVLVNVCSYINSISLLNINTAEINFQKDSDEIYAQSSFVNLKFKIGDIKTATNGQKMKLISYRNSHDVDVQFEDGTVVKHKKAECFSNGNIKNPNFYKTKIGETSFSNRGQKMTIIAWRRSDNIDIQFEDGTIVYKARYDVFKKGQIQNPSIREDYKKTRTGMSTTNTAGEKMTIIEYRSSTDIDIQFEDGTIIKNQKYQNFQNGYIKKI